MCVYKHKLCGINELIAEFNCLLTFYGRFVIKLNMILNKISIKNKQMTMSFLHLNRVEVVEDKIYLGCTYIQDTTHFNITEVTSS